MDGKLGVILREPVYSNSDDYPILESMKPDRVLIHACFDGSKNAAPRRAQKYDHDMRVLNVLDVESSLYVCERDLKKVLKIFWSNTLFIELDVDAPNENAMFDLVTKLVGQRPDIRIGLVAPLKSLLSNTRVIEMIKLLLSFDNVFECPLVGNGVIPIEEELEAARSLRPGTVPFLFYLTDDERARFSEIRGRFSEAFSEFVFWTPSVAAGIRFTEVQMTHTAVAEVTQSKTGRYVALKNIALRKAPSRNAEVTGSIEAGDFCVITRVTPEKMGIQYGQLDSNLWVILKNGQEINFEKETYDA